MLNNLVVVMVKTRFPENIGMVARACANMGAGQIILVDPKWWDIDKARPLATAKGLALLEHIHVVPTLAEAVQDCVSVWGSTARTGGWRRAIESPDEATSGMIEPLSQGNRVALVLGPEDRGLNNEEIEHCTRLLTIPTAIEASSLNVAQAALVILYELHKASQNQKPCSSKEADSRPINQSENNILFGTLRETLVAIDYIKSHNADYFLMPMRRFLGKYTIHRHEFDMLMGICRQVKRLAMLAKK